MLTRFVATVSAAAVLAQAPSQLPPPFRTGVDLVEVDVTVLDRERRPVHGLTAADFTLLENGQPQDIVAFHEVQLERPDPAAAAWTREVAPDVRTNEPLAGRLLMLVLDDATLPADPGTVKRAKDIARAVLEGLGPQDLAAVQFTQNNRQSQGFTDDRARLRTAVDRLSFGFRRAREVNPGMRPGSAPPGIGDDRLWYQYSISTIRRAAEYLIDAPQRRKTLVYVSVGVPADFTPGASEGQTAGDADAQRDLAVDMQRAFEQAVRANVTIYGIDPSGLEVSSARLNHDFLRSMSENTGGFAVLNTNTPEAAVPAVLSASGAYYLLGFQPADRTADRRFRRLRVQVNRRDVTVRARSGYYGAASPADRASGSTAAAASPVASALGGLLPKGDLPMQATAAVFAFPGRNESAAVIVTRLEQPSAVEREEQRIDVMAAAFDTNGNRKASISQTVTLPAQEGRGGSPYEVLSRLDLKPGRHLVRVAAHGREAGAAGSVHLDVDVPDVTRQAVTLSGIVLTSTPAHPAGPRDMLTPILPVIPTTRRAFQRTDGVTAFARVYQGGRSAVGATELVVTILDAAGREVFRRTDTLTPEWFPAGRAADYRVELPIARLSPGPHVLTIEAALRRERAGGGVRFTIE